MNGQNYQTPPPPPKKGGLPTWAWIVLGCLLVLILGAGATCFSVAWFAKKAGDKLSSKVTEWEKDPSAMAMDMAEFALKNHPDVDLVSIDREAKTFTVRDKKTGKETTVSLSDVENGNLSIESDGREVNVAVDGGEEGSINVTGPDGQRLQIGAGAEMPDWVPSYPGSDPKGVGTMTTPTERAGSFAFTTGDSVKAVLNHYESELEAAGFTIELRSTSGDEGGLISAKSGHRGVNIGASRTGGETQVSVNYTEKIGS